MTAAKASIWEKPKGDGARMFFTNIPKGKVKMQEKRRRTPKSVGNKYQRGQKIRPRKTKKLAGAHNTSKAPWKKLENQGRATVTKKEDGLLSKGKT